MYGFIESSYADVLVELGIISNYECYSISDGNKVAIIDRPTYLISKSAFEKMAETNNINTEYLMSIPSDINGMVTIIHPFWINPIIFDSITPGAAKECNAYLRTKEYWDQSSIPKNDLVLNFKTCVTQIVGREEVEEIDNTKDVQNNFIKKIQKSAYSDGFLCSEHNGYSLIIEKSLGQYDDVFYNLILKLKKNIVVCCMRSSFTFFIKSYCPEVIGETLFIYTTPSHKRLVDNKIKMSHTVFGYEIQRLWQVHSDSVNNSLASPMGPVFSDFDYAYRDFKTGVIWALQEKNEIFFTFNLSGCDELMKIIFEELGNRFLGAMKYEDMKIKDEEYFQKSIENNRDYFINMAVQNTQSLIQDLKNKYMEAQEKYTEFLTNAMEQAKITQRLEETIVSMNEKDIAEKERIRCEEMYKMVMEIPKVSAIKVSENIVNVYTKNIYVYHEVNKTWHDIGTFHIVIGMYKNKYEPDTTVKIFNTKYQIAAFTNDMQAPHVFSDGHICHGNIIGAMIDAYKRRDLYQMILIIIMFLENANLDDVAGAYLYKWPVVPEEKTIETKEGYSLFQEKSEIETKFDEELEIPVHI